MLGPLPPTGETRMNLWAPGFNLAQWCSETLASCRSIFCRVYLLIVFIGWLAEHSLRLPLAQPPSPDGSQALLPTFPGTLSSWSASLITARGLRGEGSWL